MSELEFESPVQAGQALDSFRESDFDFHSALYEVIDNSIQANARNIWITLDFTQVKRTSKVSYLSILDDGDGMTDDVLHRCMCLGYSTRYNQRDGIGRFGVGMTLAAISQCSKIYSWSKTESSSWSGTVLDLVKISSGEFKGLPKPNDKWKPDRILIEGQKLSDLNHGTLIVWENFDRLSHLPSKKEDVLREVDFHVGRVFRKWLMNSSIDRSEKRNVKIFLNGKQVFFHDPLFSIKSDRFPNDPISKVVTAMEFNYPVPSDVVEKGLSGGKTESKIKIQISLLPEEFRTIRGRGGIDFPGRFLDENEGVSILRAGREVHYDHLKYYTPKFKELDRWWACEIQFDPVLDKCFTVKNIKVGVRIIHELQELIRDKIEPTRKRFQDEIQKLWDKGADSNGKEGTLAEEAVKAALNKGKVTSPHTSKSNEEIIKDQNRIIERLAMDANEQEKAKLLERFKSTPYSIKDQSWPGNVFFDDESLGDNVIMILNTKHSFYPAIFRPLLEILSQDKDNQEIRLVKSGVELLLISFVNTLRTLKHNDTSTNLTWEEAETKIKDQWGQHLSAFINELKLGSK